MDRIRSSIFLRCNLCVQKKKAMLSKRVVQKKCGFLKRGRRGSGARGLLDLPPGRCGVASIAENSQRCASQTAVENTAQHRTCRSVHSNFFFFVDGGSVPETEARRILSVMESQSTARRCNRALHARFSGESDGWLKSHAHTLMLRTCQFDFNVRIRVKMCMHGIAAGPEDSQIYELT